MSYLHLFPNIPEQVHSLLVDSRMEKLNQNECSEVVRLLRENVNNTLTDFENGQFHDCFNSDEFLEAYVNRVVDSRWKNLFELNQAILKVAETMTTMPLVPLLHLFLEDSQLDQVLKNLCNFLGVQSNRDEAFILDCLTVSLQRLLTELPYTKEYLLEELLTRIFQRDELNSYRNVTVLSYFNKASQDIIFDLRPFHDQAADIFAVTNQQQWESTFQLIQSLLTALINKTQRDPHLLSQELQYAIKILDKHSIFSEEEVVSDLRGIYAKISKKYPYHPTTAPTEIPAWQPPVSELEEFNHGDTEVETPAFEYEETVSQGQQAGSDTDSYNHENQQIILRELCDGNDNLVRELVKSIEDYKNLLLENPAWKPIVTESFDDENIKLLKLRIQRSQRFMVSDDIQTHLNEVFNALIYV